MRTKSLEKSGSKAPLERMRRGPVLRPQKLTTRYKERTIGYALQWA